MCYSPLHPKLYAPKLSIQIFMELTRNIYENEWMQLSLWQLLSGTKTIFLFISTQFLTHASHTMTTVHFLIWVFPNKCISPLPQPSIYLPRDIKSSPSQCGKLFDGDTELSASSIPQLAHFLATNKIRLSVSQWFGKTQSAGRYHNHIIET